MIPNIPLNKQLEEYLKKEKEEEEKRKKEEQWKKDKAKYTGLNDVDMAGMGDLPKAGMGLASRFAGAGGRNIGCAGDLSYGGGQPLRSYYDPVAKKLIFSSDTAGGDALNALAARDLTDRLNDAGKFADFQDYVRGSMKPEDLIAAENKYKTMYNGLMFGKELDDLVNREAANEWAQKNLFGGNSEAQKLALQNPALFAAMQDANSSLKQKLGTADGVQAAQGLVDQVGKLWQNAAFAAAKRQGTGGGIDPQVYFSSGEDGNNSAAAPTSTSAPSPTLTPSPTPSPSAMPEPGPTPEPTPTAQSSIPTEPEAGPAPSDAPASDTKEKEDEKNSGGNTSTKPDDDLVAAIPIVGLDGAPDSDGINPKTGRLNIGGYDLTENDIISLSSLSYMGYTPDQCAQLFIKLKQNGKVTDQELLDLGIAKEPNWFDRLTGNTPDKNASLVTKLYQLGQEYRTSLSEMDFAERQERFNEALGIVGLAGLYEKPGKFEKVGELNSNEIYNNENTGLVGSNYSKFKPTQTQINKELVDEYVKKLKSGEDLAPVQVYEDPNKGYYIIDGHHRFVAGQIAGIPVKVSIVKANGPIGMNDWTNTKWTTYINEDQFWGD